MLQLLRLGFLYERSDRPVRSVPRRDTSGTTIPKETRLGTRPCSEAKNHRDQGERLYRDPIVVPTTSGRTLFLHASNLHCSLSHAHRASLHNSVLYLLRQRPSVTSYIVPHRLRELAFGLQSRDFTPPSGAFSFPDSPDTTCLNPSGCRAVTAKCRQGRELYPIKMRILLQTYSPALLNSPVCNDLYNLNPEVPEHG